MDQISFAEAEYAHKKRKTRREKFLERIDALIPWDRLVKKAKRHYPKGRNGRPPYPLETMLRIHCMQLFYNLSDPGMEDALYEIESMRRFAGLRLYDPLPDETTILNFRRFLERHKLGKKLFDEINRHLDDHGLMMREGSIVDASIISAPSSTKNTEGKRDPEMHQTRKGNQWFFGMKMHGDEQRAFGDAGYRGVDKRIDRDIAWHIAERPGKRRLLDPDSNAARVEKLKSQIRAKVEHPFRYIKRMFGYDKVRYRGQEKNRNRLHVLAGFTNLLLAEKFMPA